jgi:hypothetical protein
VAAPPPETLEALVRDELRAPVARLVRKLIPELVAEELNDAASAEVGPPTEGLSEPRPTPQERRAEEGKAPAYPQAAETPTKVCSLCGKAKPLDAFGQGRAQCRSCRSEVEGRRARERKRAEESEEEASGLEA